MGEQLREALRQSALEAVEQHVQQPAPKAEHDVPRELIDGLNRRGLLGALEMVSQKTLVTCVELYKMGIHDAPHVDVDTTRAARLLKTLDTDELTHALQSCGSGDDIDVAINWISLLSETSEEDVKAHLDQQIITRIENARGLELEIDFLQDM